VQPLADGHTLVVPKAHVTHIEDLTPPQADALFRAVTRLARPVREGVGAVGTTIGVNNGEATGQTIAHVHVHIVPAGRRTARAASTRSSRGRTTDRSPRSGRQSVEASGDRRATWV